MIERLSLMFYCREDLGKSSGMRPAIDTLLKKYKNIKPFYPFVLPEIEFPNSQLPKPHYGFKFYDYFPWEKSHLLGDQYLLSCEQGKKDEVVLQEMVWKFCVRRLEYFPTRDKPPQTEREKNEASGMSQRMRVLYYEMQMELEKRFTALLSELGDLLGREENHIKTDSGQFEPVYGPQRSHHDMVAEIANTLTKLPRFQARCIIDEYDEQKDESRPVEYLIRTVAPPAMPDDAEEQAAYIIARSQQLYAQKQDDDKHGILDERKPADDDANRSVSRADEPAQPPPHDEDDYFR